MGSEEMKMSNEERAREIAKGKIGFYTHLFVYFVVIGFLTGLNFFINSKNDSKNYWFFWPAAGWGVGLLCHFITIFVAGGSLEDRIAAKELERLNNKGGE